MLYRVLLIVVAVLLAVPGWDSVTAATPVASPVSLPAPPTQPTSGPGGADYAYDAVIATQHGEEISHFWLFVPEAPRAGTPSPTGSLPVVLFLSGCCVPSPAGASPEPDPHRAWIDHIVRRGAVVVYVVYQEVTWQADIVASVRAAQAELERPGSPPVDLTQVALVGWSYGARLAGDYAATAAAEGLPVPALIMFLMPSCCPVEDLAAVSAETRVLVVAAANDANEGENGAKRIWEGLTAVPLDQRDYVVLASDDHGPPPLIADHFVAMTSEVDFIPLDRPMVDALDWFGLWKWLDGLMACSFDGQWCEYALGNTPEQRFMGTWSDGEPVTEPVVTDDPAAA